MSGGIILVALPREVVVRCDERVGSFTSEGGWSDIEVQSEPAAAPMGAGDAFIAGRLIGNTPLEAMRFAVGRAVALWPSDTSDFPRNMLLRT